MTDTAAIITEGQATRGRISEARAEAADALNLAYELAEVATAHGCDGVGAASVSVDDARQACQQAGEPYELLQILQVVTDDLGQARQNLDKARGTTEAERQAAETWGD